MTGLLPDVTLEGRHVRLEPLTLAHAPALARAASGDRGSFALTFVPDGEADARAYLEEAMRQRAAGISLGFATVAKDAIGDRPAGEVVGSSRLCIDRWQAGPDGAISAGPDAVEIGYTWLASHAQRTAVNTEAKLLMLGHAFDVWGVHCVRLKTDARNARSRAAIARLGAKFDGIQRAHMRASDGTPRDSAFFSILAAEWPDVKRGLEARLSARKA